MSLTLYQSLYILVLYLVLLFFSWKSLKTDFVLRSVYRRFLILGIVIFFLFPFYGDYYHYMEIFDSLRAGDTTHLEIVYTYIARLSGFYTVWRIIVWGSAFFLIMQTFRRLNVKYEYCLFFCVALYLPWLSYSRFTLAMALTFWGLSYLVKPLPYHYIFSFFLGIIAIGCSYFFHRTALFAICMCLCGLFTIKMKKYWVIICILLIPLFYTFIENFLNSFMNFEADPESFQVVQHGQVYMGSEKTKQGGIGLIVRNFLIRAPYYIILIVYLLTVFQDKYKKFSQDVKIFSSTSAIIIVGASAFLLNFGNINTNVLYYRFLYFSMIPAIIFMAYCFENHLYKRLIKTLLYLGVLGNIYTFLYGIYCSN